MPVVSEAVPTAKGLAGAAAATGTLEGHKLALAGSLAVVLPGRKA